MKIRFRQKCIICKKNYADMEAYMQRAVCALCQMKEISKPIKNKKMDRFFRIKQEFYLKSGLLREIKSKYLKFGSLTQPQIDAFKRVVKEIRASSKISQKTSQ